MAFMVRYGFSLAELRQLYIDELFSFLTELSKILEAEGILKKGSADIASGEDDVNLLRKQLRNIIK